MDELKEILQGLTERVNALSPAAPTTPATPEIVVTPETKTEPVAVATPAVVTATAADLEALRSTFAASQLEMTSSVKSLAETMSALLQPQRSHAFDTSSVAAGGPAYLRLTSDIKANASVPMWLRTIALSGIGRGSLDMADQIRVELDKKALAEGNLAVVPNAGADLGTGGALAPVELNQQIIDYLWPNVIIRKAGAETYNMRAAEMIMPRILPASGSVQGTDPSINPFPAFTAESGVIPATTMAFGQKILRPQELATIIAVSRQLVMDGDPNVEAVLRDALVKGIGAIEDRNFLLGTGVSPIIKGLFKYVSGDGANVVSKGANGGALIYDDLVNAISALMAAGVPMSKACWIMNPLLLGGIRKLKDTQGRPLFVEYMDIQSGSMNVHQMAKVPTLFGMPIFLSQQIPVNGTKGTGTNTTTLALVDMNYVKIGQRGTLELTTSTDASYVDVGGGSEQSAFIRNQMLFRVLTRVDITMTQPSALYLLTDITGY